MLSLWVWGHVLYHNGLYTVHRTWCIFPHDIELYILIFLCTYQSECVRHIEMFHSPWCEANLYLCDVWVCGRMGIFRVWLCEGFSLTGCMMGKRQREITHHQSDVCRSGRDILETLGISKCLHPLSLTRRNVWF